MALPRLQADAADEQDGDGRAALLAARGSAPGRCASFNRLRVGSSGHTDTHLPALYELKGR